MAKIKNTGLGKGLGALLPNIEKNEKSSEIVTQFKMLPLEDITKNPYQPRIDFDPEELEDLISSIKIHGVITPVTVRKIKNGFELIAGERRLRASKEAQIKEIPAYILDVNTNSEMLEIALIENLQRDDLNPIETALGFKRLIDECKLTQEQVALKVGKNRSTVTNFLRLIKLPEDIQQALRDNKISMGHARALLAFDTPDLMIDAYNTVLNKGLNVRDTEDLVKTFNNKKQIKLSENNIEVKEPEVKDLEDKLRHFLSTEVKINTKNNKSGKIVIDFYSEDDFERIIEQIVNV
ncbi:ParB/RepB/Spo0J family partition protein [Candidatus Kapabacteria bacterium]|nr:ParB/RepB/Spo0J family partition protein [Candidatus Kapabacteria bacterium]